jgi:hypothetical protein
VEITFWAGNELIDVIEFPVFRDGKIVAKINELKDWLEDKFKEVIEARITAHGGITSG